MVKPGASKKLAFSNKFAALSDPPEESSAGKSEKPEPAAKGKVTKPGCAKDKSDSTPPPIADPKDKEPKKAKDNNYDADDSGDDSKDETNEKEVQFPVKILKSKGDAMAASMTRKGSLHGTTKPGDGAGFLTYGSHGEYGHLDW